MTETKRFGFGGTYEDPTIKDNVTGIEYPSEGYSLLQLINDLFDENEQLKKELESERQYILYLKSVLEDNEIWYND